MKITITIEDSPTERDPNAVELRLRADPAENDQPGDRTPATQVAAQLLAQTQINWPTGGRIRRH